MAAPGKKRRLPARTKASAQYLHAKRRARERYGLELSKAQYQTLCNGIRAGVGVNLGKQSLRLSVWRIDVVKSVQVPGPYQTVACNVIYDKSRGTIVTFLPPGITDAKGVAL